MGMDIRQTNCPLRHKGGTWGGGGAGLGGQQFKSMGRLSDRHQLWFMSADSSANGHRLNTSRPSKHSKVLGSCQTAGPISTNFGSRLRIHLGMDIG